MTDQQIAPRGFDLSLLFARAVVLGVGSSSLGAIVDGGMPGVRVVVTSEVGAGTDEGGSTIEVASEEPGEVPPTAIWVSFAVVQANAKPDIATPTIALRSGYERDIRDSSSQAGCRYQC
jgi:hypothetical protein